VHVIGFQGGSAVLLDVREADEYAVSHVTFATCAPLSTLKAGVFPESRESGNPCVAVSPNLLLVLRIV
jgi:rhodanese-related sulfurtransferase